MKIQRLRGMHDIFGPDATAFQKAEAAARSALSRFGFSEIRTPILEEKELFSRALGTETDVVQKEMYEFTDRSKVQVAMRPEGTAGIVRAYLENDLDKSEGLCKFYYIGAMYRSERPQAGRLRQFHQIGAEVLGTDSPLADAEAITALTVFLDEAGAGGYRVKLNNLGTFDERKDFRKNLHDFFAPKKNELCDDCKLRLEKNVFRLLDCKVESCRQIAAHSPLIQDHLTAESKAHFDAVTAALDLSGVKWTLEPRMVRGLDYYTRTVFEITHEALGAQDALAAGGRYDKLIEAFGGKTAGAVGFAVGLERLLMVTQKAERTDAFQDAVFLVTLGDAAAKKGFSVMMDLRRQGIRAEMDLAPKSMKSQMRMADKTKSRFALILGDNELQSGQWMLKDMQGGTQEAVPAAELTQLLKGKFKRA